jgi:hypothetical protein
MTQEALSEDIEALLVARNPRGMQTLRAALEPGYTLRAARVLTAAKNVIIGTGFPVANTFETDGPLGSIALYRALERCGSTCHIACARPLAAALEGDFRIIELEAFDPQAGREEARRNLARFAPDMVVSIERPGLAADGRYYNMRGEDITADCAVFDYYLEDAQCPTIAIGDGGNEIGMGRVAAAVTALSIRAAATSCDELIVADVSNWGAYALIALMEAISGQALLERIEHRRTLAELSARGSVDGVTRENTLTEDGLPVEAGELLLAELARLVRGAVGAAD